jgi:two-component system, NarL family, response regulator LiaR
MTIRVLLVDDHAIVRAGLRALLHSEADIEVIGDADTGQAGINMARRLRPDVVVTDLLLPGVDGLALTQTVCSELPNTHVVVLTSVSDEDAAFVRAIRAGAISYILKNADIRLLVEAIRSAADGQVLLSSAATARLMREMRAPSSDLPLTEREREVLREMAIGRSNKQIACSLHIAETTVKSHVRVILEKLGVQSRTQAALHAVRAQLVSPADLKAA